jgi:hypothetical protein
MMQMASRKILFVLVAPPGETALAPNFFRYVVL